MSVCPFPDQSIVQIHRLTEKIEPAICASESHKAHMAIKVKKSETRKYGIAFTLPDSARRLRDSRNVRKPNTSPAIANWSVMTVPLLLSRNTAFLIDPRPSFRKPFPHYPWDFGDCLSSLTYLPRVSLASLIDVSINLIEMELTLD